MKTGIAVSDLHMLTRRSGSNEIWPAVERAIKKSDMLVLNGDTFDFRWTINPSTNESIDTAISWLRDLACRHPQLHINFILGNHDYYGPFLTRLDELVEQTPNLFRHDYYFQLDRLLFLHGDCANPGIANANLEKYRAQWLHDNRRSEFKGKMYVAIHSIGLAYIIHKVAFPRRLVAARIIAWIKSEHPDLLNQIDNIYFGHTHLPMESYAYNGLHFHNSGAAVSGMKFKMLRFEYKGEESKS